MTAYIIRRLLLIIPTLIIITMTVFLLLRFIPGSLLDVMLAENASIGAADVIDRDALSARLGLDQPMHVSYLRWVGILPDRDTGRFSGLLQGDLGDSLWRNDSVLTFVLPRVPVSLELGILAIIIAQLIALPIGIYSAIRQDTAGDYAGRSIAILMMSVPTIWVGMMVMTFPAIWWNYMPPIRYIPFFDNPLVNLRQFLVPAAVIAMAMAGGTMRYTRTMMLEVLKQDYIRTAWAKGLKERVVVMRHALKNAFIPVVTIIGLQVPVLIGGSVIIEKIFVLPGLGRLLLEGIQFRDYAIVSGVNVIYASFVLFSNLVVDLTYGFLDPRITYK